MRNIVIILFFVLFTFSAVARPIIADLSLRKVDIDSGFTGTEILLFGARNDAGDIVVVIRGPKISYIVRKKERIAGVWVNKKQVVFNGANGFYAVASNRPLDDIKNNHLLDVLDVGLEQLSFNTSTSTVTDNKEFTDAFLDKQQQRNLYTPEIGEVSFIGDTLFRTIVKFPENIPRGIYTAEVYLFNDGQLAGIQTTPLIVHKTGFDAWVYDFAYNHSAIYGIIAVLLALTTGWAAGHIFKRVV